MGNFSLHPRRGQIDGTEDESFSLHPRAEELSKARAAEQPTVGPESAPLLPAHIPFEKTNPLTQRLLKGEVPVLPVPAHEPAEYRVVVEPQPPPPQPVPIPEGLLKDVPRVPSYAGVKYGAGPRMISGQQLEEEVSRPLVPLGSEFRKARELSPPHEKGLAQNIIEDSAQLAGNTIEGLSTPKNVALIGSLAGVPAVGTWKIAHRAVAGLFSADMATAAADEFSKGYDSYLKKDWQGVTDHWGGGLGSLTFSLLAAKGVSTPLTRAEKAALSETLGEGARSALGLRQRIAELSARSPNFRVSLEPEPARATARPAPQPAVQPEAPAEDRSQVAQPLPVDLERVKREEAALRADRTIQQAPEKTRREFEEAELVMPRRGEIRRGMLGPRFELQQTAEDVLKEREEGAAREAEQAPFRVVERRRVTEEGLRPEAAPAPLREAEKPPSGVQGKVVAIDAKTGLPIVDRAAKPAEVPKPRVPAAIAQAPIAQTPLTRPEAAVPQEAPTPAPALGKPPEANLGARIPEVGVKLPEVEVPPAATKFEQGKARFEAAKTPKLTPQFRSLADELIAISDERQPADSQVSPETWENYRSQTIMGRVYAALTPNWRGGTGDLQAVKTKLAEAGFAGDAPVKQLIEARRGEWSAGPPPVLSKLEEGRARFEAAKAQSGKLPEAELPQPPNVRLVPTNEIVADPARFQFRTELSRAMRKGIQSGEVEFNPLLAGEIQVWRDPASGKTYVINGHHRLEIAKRTGAPQVKVEFMDAPDAASARAQGALVNIAEGNATPVDVAKFMRDSGMSEAELRRMQLPVGGPLIRDGLALSKLDAPIFEQVSLGKVPEKWGAAIGEHLEDPATQHGLLALLRRQEERGAKLSEGEITALARRAQSAGKTTEQGGLFGPVDVSNAIEAARVEDYIKRRLSHDRRLFGFVAKETRAKELERAGNIIEVSENQRIAEQSRIVEDAFNRLVSFKGPVDDAINLAAASIKRGEDINAARQGAYDQVVEAVEKTLVGPEGGRYEAGAKDRGQIEGPGQVAESVRPVGETALPGMESAVREQEGAVQRYQGEELTRELEQGKGEEISAATGEMERRSPLFRESEASGQREMFKSGTPSEDRPTGPGDVTLSANPVFNPRFWELADAALRPFTQKIERTISLLVGRLPFSIRKWFQEDPRMKEIIQEARREVGQRRSETDAVLRMVMRSKPTPQELVIADRMARGIPENLSPTREPMRNSIGEAAEEAHALAQQMTSERAALGLPVREEWIEGPKHWYPNLWKQHLFSARAVAGRLFAIFRRAQTQFKPSITEMGSLHPRTTDRWVVVGHTGNPAKTDSGQLAIFKTGEQARAFADSNSGFKLIFFDKGERGLKELTFPTIKDRSAWVNEQGEEITVRQMLPGRHLRIVQPMTHEQAVAHGLIENLALNLRYGFGKEWSLIAKTRALETIGRELASDTAQQGYVKLSSVGFEVPPKLAERNPYIGRLRDGFVPESVAETLTAYYGRRGVWDTRYRLMEGALRKWVTVFSPFRHPRNLIENEVALAFGDPKAALNIPAMTKAFRDFARGARGEKDVPHYDEYTASGLASTDIMAGEFATVWRGIDTVQPGVAPLSLTERLAIWAETNPAAAQLLRTKNFVERLYRAEDQVWKYYFYRTLRERGWASEAAAYRARRTFFDYEDVPPIIRSINRYVPFIPNITYQYARILGTALRDRPASTAMKVALFAYGYAFMRDEIMQKAGITEQDEKNMGKLGLKPWEFPLPMTDDKGRNLVVNLQWAMPFSEVEMLRYAATEEEPERGFAQATRRFLPMIAQSAATAISQRGAFGQKILTGTETQEEAKRKLAREVILTALPGLLGQYWDRLYKNAMAGPEIREPWWQRLAEGFVGNIQRIRPGEKIELRKALIAGQGRAVQEEAGRQRGRLIRGSETEETFREQIGKLRERSEEEGAAHPQTLRVVKALEERRNGEARAEFQKLKDSGFYANSEEATKAIRDLLSRRGRLAEMEKAPLVPARDAVAAIVDEVRRTGRVSQGSRRILEERMKALSESDQDAVLDYLEQQMRIAREERKGQSREPELYPPAGLRESAREPAISPVR